MKIKITMLLTMILVMGGIKTAQAQYYSFCADQIITLKGGLIGGDLGAGFEQRCGAQDGGVFTFSTLDYTTQKGSSITVAGTTTSTPRSHSIGAGGGLGYNFTDVIGLSDLHPFLGVGLLLGVNFVSDDFSGGAGIQAPVGADYLVSEGFAIGAEYVFNHIWDFNESGLNGASHDIMLRLSFWL